MKRLQMVVACVVAFGLGGLADREYRVRRGPKGPLAHMSHVGILVPDLDKAVARFTAMGFRNISVSPRSAGPSTSESHYHGQPLDCPLQKAFITGTVPEIELMQPACDCPNPWSSELSEHGQVLHHIAYTVDDEVQELALFQNVGMNEIAGGRWPEGRSTWATWHYVKDPSSALIVEFLSTSPRTPATVASRTK